MKEIPQFYIIVQTENKKTAAAVCFFAKDFKQSFAKNITQFCRFYLIIESYVTNIFVQSSNLRSIAAFLKIREIL